MLENAIGQTRKPSGWNSLTCSLLANIVSILRGLHMQTEPAKIYIAAHKIFDTGTTLDRVMLQFLLSKNAQQSPRACVCRFGRHIHCTSMPSVVQPPFAVKRFPSELCCPFSLGWNWAQLLSHTKYQGGHSVPTQDNYYTFPQTCRMQSRGTANRTAHLARQSIRAPQSVLAHSLLCITIVQKLFGGRGALLLSMLTVDTQPAVKREMVWALPFQNTHARLQTWKSNISKNHVDNT